MFFINTESLFIISNLNFEIHKKEWKYGIKYAKYELCIGIEAFQWLKTRNYECLVYDS